MNRHPLFRVAVITFTVLLLGLLRLSITSAVEPDAAPVAGASDEESTPPSDSGAIVTPTLDPADESPSSGALTEIEKRPEEPPPFDFAPYRVLIWIASDNPRVDADSIREELSDYLDRDFFSVWRTVVADAPPAVASIAQRDLGSITFDRIAASDPVIALKYGHKDSLRIHFASDAGRFLQTIPGTQGRVQDIRRRIAENPELKTTPTKFVWQEKLKAIRGDAVALAEMWADETTEALLVSRGMADTFTEPKAKIIVLPLAGQVVDAIEQFDKIYVARIQTETNPANVEVIELDTLMRHFSHVTHRDLVSHGEIAMSVGITIREAFSPVVRIDDAGRDSAVGLVRASGLALDPDSPIHVRIGDVLEPLVRKDDRNGRPIAIGPLDWAYLISVEPELAGFGAADPGLRLGDSINTVAQKAILKPHTIARTIQGIPTDTYEIEVQRGGKPENIKIKKSETLALTPQYFGVIVREKRTKDGPQTIVMEVLDESPAAGKFQQNDVILSINGVKDLDAAAILQIIVTTPDSPNVKFTVLRGEATETITITPSPISNRQQTAPSTVKMDFYAGRVGGLQGRKNNRTHRMGIRVHPRFDDTMLRLHAKGNPNEPLIGYEIYDKELESSAMTFVGRTDWNGRMDVEKIDRPLRLLYVKNGGAVLARLPIVPGHHETGVADLAGDDMRLQAEAYIRGVQNAIVDLVAIRELFKARIMMRIKEGKVKEADDLLELLRNEPSNEIIANDMGVKQTMFLKAIGRNPNQQTKVDQMFRTTRELLSKQINPKVINDLEKALIEAKD